MTPDAQLSALETGTPMDKLSASRPDVQFDAVFTDKHFGGIRLQQPDRDTLYATPGMDSISVTVWGDGTRSTSTSVAGKGIPDQICSRGMTSILPAHTDCRLVLQPTSGHNFTFFLSPSKFADTFQDDHPAGKIIEVREHLLGQDTFLFDMAEAYMREFSDARQFSSIALETIAMQVSLHLARHYSSWVDKAPGNSACLLEEGRVSRVKEYIDTHLHLPLSLSEIAGVACLSQYHFSRVFKATQGVSPYQYIISQRVERARSMLGDARYSLAQISILCGFSSQQHMTDLFRKTYHTTPGAMRRALSS